MATHLVSRGATDGELVDLRGDFSTPFWTACDIGASGASLVRPDGDVAWRQAEASSDAAERLTHALAAVLGVAVPARIEALAA